MSRASARKISLFGGWVSLAVAASACFLGCGSASKPTGPVMRSTGSVDAGLSASQPSVVPPEDAGGASPDDDPGTGGSTGAGGASQALPGAQAGEGSAPEASTDEPCSASLPRRLVRLTFPQIVNSIEGLLGPELAGALREEHVIEPAHGTYRQHLLPSEGQVIGESVWSVSDAIADTSGRWVEANFEALTQCGSDVACSREFVQAFTERLFRRPASGDELDVVLSVFDEAVGLDGSPALATRFGVYAALSSPLFLYRSELGASDATGAVIPLDDHELASAVSFFLTDGPPDDELVSAAASGTLSTEAALEGQVDRLLGGEPARTQLERTMFGYLEYPIAEAVIVDPEIFPEWDATLRASALGEARRFLEFELWRSPLEALVTSRRAFVDENLAASYGVPFPPEDVLLDEEGFASVELPSGRAGVLTQAAFLVGMSRPDGHSVIMRGLQVNDLFACLVANPPPEDPAIVQQVVEQIASAETEREKAEIRAAEPLCATCHALFDPFGLVLEAYDVLGRYRTEDDEGRPIDPVVSLPEPVTGTVVGSPAELGVALVQSGRFATCVARGFASHALGDEGAATCVADDVANAPSYVADPTYSELIRQIARSPVFTGRTREEP